VAGNWGYIDRYPNTQGRYPAAKSIPGDDSNFTQFNKTRAGGSHVVVENDLPFLHGPTYTGFKRLQDVP
jgi:hypothetical protein